MQQAATATGKIILCGEYAVLFGKPGIAIPAPLSVTATFEKDPSLGDVIVEWDTNNQQPTTNDWHEYVDDIVNLCLSLGSIPPGILRIENTIPLGKGMGASTAFCIAIAKCLLGQDSKKQARMIEDALNPGHSGIDFAVIWNQKPIKFTKGAEVECINLPNVATSNFSLIDTDTPDQATPELVEWVQENYKDSEQVRLAIEQIGACCLELQQVSSLPELKAVISKHHEAQCALGIVTDKAKSLITKIEQEGGAAKVIGAGSRTGGCGMILAFGVKNIPEQYCI